MQTTKQFELTEQTINTLRELCTFALAALAQRKDYHFDRAKITKALNSLGEPNFLTNNTIELPALTKQRRAWTNAAIRHGFISPANRSCSNNEQDSASENYPPL